MRYKQLTQEERYQISALLKAGLNQSEIAMILERHKSTISREISRNTGLRGYRPKQAQHRAEARRYAKICSRISHTVWRDVRRLLREDWSPEQISLWLESEKAISISHEWIYQYILQDKQYGGTLYRHLRCQKQRRKRYGSYNRRGQLIDRVSIDERPKIVDSRTRMGDWELDTIIGKHHKHAIVSLTERKSRFTLIKKVKRKTAQCVTDAIIHLLAPFSEQVHTLTSDNGKEFADHKTIANKLNAKFYFAHPYASWERGLNENTNGLIRQYFPKKRDFRTITQKEINRVMDKLNNRPRKCLGIKTPNQVFLGINPSVALVS
ncbi:MAG: IS30 family transposase [Phycisphaerae bacterium]|nr:IS30 family transposase [Phycisphaerae bacterium]NIR47576.1 IS30 family transposase [candidate division KSB1 bacterium]NIW10613.1 IS30 family transposase [Gammaproteobacteria bacterium]NIR71690.1 IS30 family transposase [candidate division KSB1 bacterium]NIU23636.1 IS30 family transposase [candidate division KSB1 bacterium]